MNFFKYISAFLLITSLFASSGFAQKQNNEDPNKSNTHAKKAKSAADIADKYFNNDEFYLASQEYVKAVNEDPKYLYALYKLAESYRLYFNYDKAQKYYKQVIDIDPSVYPLARYWYASMLKNRAQYEEALINFESFIEEYPSEDPNADQLKEKARIDAEGCRLAMNELKKPVRNYSFNVLPAPVNSGNSDYAPAIYENDTSIVISSGRKGTVGNKENTVLGGNTTDNFRFSRKPDTTWSNEPDDDNFSIVNSEFDENTGSFTADKKKFYFTRCDEKVKEEGYQTFECVIYVTKLIDGKWSKPERLNDNINEKGQWSAQPSVSPKGDSLFFVSKRPGGKGRHDIYLSTSSGNDNWGPARNLPVNTPFIDMSPCYYSKEKTLFFSTNGREGFGGLDIFKATGARLDSVENIGLPFNSNMDDFYFVLGEEKGYLSSNREGGLGNDDIYMFNVKSKEAIIAQVNKDSLLAEIARDSAIAAQTSLARLNSDDYNSGADFNEAATENKNSSNENQTDFATATENGEKSGKDSKGVTTENSADIQNQQTQNKSLTSAENNTEKGKPEIKNDQGVEKVKSISIVGTVLYDDTKQPAVDVENKLKDKEGKVIKTTKTNEQGNFRFDNLPIEDYKVEIEDKDPRLTGDIQYIVEDVKVKKSNKEVSKLLFENIYFNFDKYSLRREARKVLRELADFYKKYPEIQIEMNASTDSYGTDDYNRKLSEKRGNAALDYLINKGVDKSALVVNALGESNPIATNRNAAGRQLNRRVEFFILGGAGYQAKAMTYIVDPNATLEDIASRFNMTVDELKELNGMDSDELEAYQPLRVRRTGDADIIAPVTLALVNPAPNDSSVNPKFALHQSNPEKYRNHTKLKKGQDYYIVAPKNTLFSIARLFGMSVDELRSLNKLTSDQIFIGDRLVVNTLSSAQVKEDWKYVVKEGDSMASIAKQFGLTPKQLMEMNGLAGYKLYEHMILRVK